MERVKAALKPLIRRHQDEAIGLVVGEPLARLIACYLRRDPRVQLDERLPRCGFERIDVPPELLATATLDNRIAKYTTVWPPRRLDRRSRRPRGRGRSPRSRQGGVDPWPETAEASLNAWHGHFEPKRVPEGVWMRCDGCQRHPLPQAGRARTSTSAPSATTTSRSRPSSGSRSSSTPTPSRSGSPTSSPATPWASTTAAPIPSGSRPSRSGPA